MVLNDRAISLLCGGVDLVEHDPSIWGYYRANPMIDPFVGVSEGKPSYGLGSYGYDIRLGKKYMVQVETGVSWNESDILDPINTRDIDWVEMEEQERILLMPHSFILGESVETFNIPENVIGLCYGKSTYARGGIIVNVTPLEPGWKGVLTMEIANIGNRPVHLHVNKGIAQIVFLKGNTPARTYSRRESGGVYQDQTGVTPGK